MFLLDTNVVSELRKIGTSRADNRVASWARQLDASTAYVSVVTLLELEIGVQRKERNDPRQGTVLRRWLKEKVLLEFDRRILPIDQAVVQRCASLHVPNPRSFRDSLIAATALVHGMTVATRNVEDFAGTGASLLNPWR